MSQTQNAGRSSEDVSCVDGSDRHATDENAEEMTDPSRSLSFSLGTDAPDAVVQCDTKKPTEEAATFHQIGVEGETTHDGQAVEHDEDVFPSETAHTLTPIDKDRVVDRGSKKVKYVSLPGHAVSRGLSKLKVIWKKSNPKLVEEHDGREVCFSVYISATMGLGVDSTTIGSLVHLPCGVEVAGAQKQRIEVLFVIRSKRGCTFVVFDEMNKAFSFLRPIDIVAVLEFLPNRKVVARTRISAAVAELERVTNRVSVKRKCGENWQGPLLALLGCMMGGKISDEQTVRLENLRKCLLEKDQPAKKAKPAGVVTKTA
jgi:hypothetical protein